MSIHFLIATAIPEGRVFGLDQQTLIQVIANAFNVSLLAIVLTWLLYKPVRNFMQKRTDRIRGQLEQAEQEVAKAGELKSQYEQKLSDIERERDEILDQARKTAVETGRQLVAEAKKEAETVRERAAANVEMEWERVQSEMKMAIIEVSAAMTEKFVARAIDKETQEKLFAETMAELGEVAWRS